MTLHTKNLFCELLTNPSCLVKAKALLYESYISHLAWEIVHENPSNIQISHHNNQTILTDDYDELSSWFALKHDNNIIACARLCYEDNKGLLEIERYENAVRILNPILSKKKSLNLVELNREAILPSNRMRSFYALILLKNIFLHCLSNNYSVLTTSNIPEWVSIYKMIRFTPLDEYTFRYFDSEPKPVLVYLATSEDLLRLLQNIDYCLNNSIINDSIDKEMYVRS